MPVRCSVQQRAACMVCSLMYKEHVIICVLHWCKTWLISVFHTVTVTALSPLVNLCGMNGRCESLWWKMTAWTKWVQEKKFLLNCSSQNSLTMLFPHGFFHALPFFLKLFFVSSPSEIYRHYASVKHLVLIKPGSSDTQRQRHKSRMWTQTLVRLMNESQRPEMSRR